MTSCPRFLPGLLPLVALLLVALLLVAGLFPLAAPSFAQRPGESAERTPDGVSALAFAAAMEQTLTESIAKAERSVVAIARVRKLEGARPGQIPLGAGERGPMAPDFVPNEFATGVVIDRRGLILTNYHVLGKLEENDYYVWADRTPYKVERIKAADPWMDLAVLQIKAEKLVPMQFGSAEDLKKGHLVIALGNPYAIARDGEVSATWGIVSNLQRQAPPLPDAPDAVTGRETLHHYGTLIQTDARLNLGTSGGALINLKGQMVGLTTSLAAQAGFEKAAGFAIPVNADFKRVVEKLKQGLKAEYGFLGVLPVPLSVAERQSGRFGAEVSIVVHGTPAFRAGLQTRDVITHVDGQPIYDDLMLICQLSSKLADTPVQLTVERFALPSVTIHKKVVLSKKALTTRRPPYSETTTPRWRGMQVEYATAMPQFQQQSRQADAAGSVGVLDVERDSVAWRAGVRAGAYVTHVHEQRVGTPAEFLKAVQDRTNSVKLRLSPTSPSQSGQVLTVPPEG